MNLRSDTLERKEIQVEVFLKEIIERLKPIADLRDIIINFNNASEHTIEADPVLLERAISNLIDNSLKYAPEESSIEITTVNENDTLQISVLDHGPGFANADVDELFTRFKRGDATAGTIGSGLGLTIARDVVVAHGGNVLLSNVEGGGACATISLPG